MVRPTDKETTATEKITCYSEFSKSRVCHTLGGGVPGKYQGQLGGRGSEEEMWSRDFL